MLYSTWSRRNGPRVSGRAVASICANVFVEPAGLHRQGLHGCAPRDRVTNPLEKALLRRQIRGADLAERTSGRHRKHKNRDRAPDHRTDGSDLQTHEEEVVGVFAELDVELGDHDCERHDRQGVIDLDEVRVKGEGNASCMRAKPHCAIRSTFSSSTPASCLTSLRA